MDQLLVIQHRKVFFIHQNIQVDRDGSPWRFENNSSAIPQSRLTGSVAGFPLGFYIERLNALGKIEKVRL